MYVAARQRPGPATRHLAHVIATAIRETRLAIGLTQSELARQASTSQSTISRIETGRLERLDLLAVGRTVDSLGLRADLRLESPVLSDRRRQRDPAHARGVAYISKRLERDGWDVRREVPVGSEPVLGWIDVLGFRKGDRALFVCEFKTDLVDIGALERTVALYERESRRAAVGFGWRPATMRSALFVLDTVAVTERIRTNRVALSQSFPTPADELATWLERPGPPAGPCPPGLAMVNPLSRRAAWLREPAWDRRHAAPRFVDYADFVRHCGTGSLRRPAMRRGRIDPRHSAGA